jgi:hypothetical protein
MAKAKPAAGGTDQKTLDLIALVAKQKSEISKAEKPNWKTNCSFSYVEGRAVDTISLHVETDVRKLIQIAAFLQDKETSYKRAATDLGVDTPPEFLWGNSPVADWIDDLKNRITKIQIGAKKKKLEALEARLNAIVSPELRAKLELEAIAAELG